MIRIENGSFYYKNRENAEGLKEINLHIKKGEIIVICGESGCGKSTLSRLINGLIPHHYEGKLGGKIYLAGAPIVNTPLHEIAKRVGSVFQNPRSQFFNINTTNELAFACENMGIEKDEIFRRIEKNSREFEIDHLLNRNLFHLSGGEKQKIACASASTASPDIFVLDEPSSNLDIEGIHDLARIITMWKREGKTVVIAEHRLHFLEPLADRFIFMKEGRIEKIYTPDQLTSISRDEYLRLGIRPLRLESINYEGALQKKEYKIRITDFSFSFSKGKEVFNFKELDLPANAAVAIIGRNGTGKTTFARSLCGLEKKCKGKVKLEEIACPVSKMLKHCYMVMQDVNHQLFTESVLDEVLLSMDDEDELRAVEILRKLNLHKERDKHPMSLSGGQKQRLAIAGAVASKKKIIFFDEPTSGLDMRHMKEVSTMIKELRESGKSIFVITHDPDLIGACCSHIMHIENGKKASIYPLDTAGREKVGNFFQINPFH